jgi:hypothetical protein
MDFTGLPWANGNKYLLVCVCTFLGWVEVFPGQTKRAPKVAWLLLKEMIIPCCGILLTIGSDNGPAFIKSWQYYPKTTDTRLGTILVKVHKWVQECLPINLSSTIHPYQPGDLV